MRYRTLAVGPALMSLLLGASAWADPQSGAAAAGQSVAILPAAWTPKELQFTYQTRFTTKYSCDGLRDRMRKLLINLGAREDIRVYSFGCVQPAGPDVFPGVRVKMSVLEPAHEWAIGQTVPARWKHVDLLADRDAVSASADCELIQQIKQQVLPLFATRNLDYSARCEKNHLVVGGTRLTADVLVQDQSVRVTGTAR